MVLFAKRTVPVVAGCCVEMIQMIVDDYFVETVWIGENLSTDISPAIHFQNDISSFEAVNIIKNFLQENGIILI